MSDQTPAPQTTGSAKNYDHSSAVELALVSGFSWLARDYKYPEGLSAKEFGLKLDAMRAEGLLKTDQAYKEINDELIKLNPELKEVRRESRQEETQKAGTFGPQEKGFCMGVICYISRGFN